MSLDRTYDIARPGGVELRLPLAGLAPRSLAWLFDAAIKSTGLGVVSIVLGMLGDLGLGSFFLVWLLSSCFYNVLFEVFYHGATPGKRYVGLAVMNLDGTPVGWSGSLIRNLIRAMDVLPGCYAFGCISVLVSGKFQRVGDLAAGTVVVHRAAELRPRSPWEAADFGVRLVRRDAAAIYRIWFAVTLPFALLAVLATAYTPFATLAALVYWWLEPIADGPILEIISRRLSGEEARVRAALKSTPALAWRNRIFLLSPYRFHMARSIAMPLTQIEGMRGKSRRARARVFNPRIMSYGFGVTVVYQHLFLSLYLGAILIGLAFVLPAYQDMIGLRWLDQFSAEYGRTAAILGFLLAYGAQTALEPWFVGAGFGLYVNGRTELEA